MKVFGYKALAWIVAIRLIIAFNQFCESPPLFPDHLIFPPSVTSTDIPPRYCTNFVTEKGRKHGYPKNASSSKEVHRKNQGTTEKRFCQQNEHWVGIL